MKKILLINLILVSCLTFSFGQQKVVLDSIYVYTGNDLEDWELYLTEYKTYDEAVNLMTEKVIRPTVFESQKEYIYDDYGNITQTTEGFIDQNDGHFKNFRKEEFTYNQDKLIIENSVSEWDEDEQKWIKTNHCVIDYDDKGRWINKTINSDEKMYRVFDGDLLLKRVHQYKRNNNWEDWDITIWNFDDKQRLINLRLIEVKTIETLRLNYAYNDLNQIIEIEQFSFGQKKSKDSLFYNLDNEVVEYRQFAWDNGWNFGDKRILLAYDTQHNMVESMEQFRKKNNEPWQNKTKTIYIYNENNQIIEYYNKQDWDTINNIWYGGLKILSTYDAENLIESDRYQWSDLSAAYSDKVSKHVYYFSEKPIILSTPFLENNCPFINPYPAFTTINCEYWQSDKTYQLTVFSIDGKLVYTQSFNGLEGFRVEKHIDRGWYVFVILEDGKIIQKQKILVF